VCAVAGRKGSVICGVDARNGSVDGCSVAILESNVCGDVW
jgi:hypothetical protein